MNKEVCNICKNNNLKKVIELKNQKNTSLFPLYGEGVNLPEYPIQLSLCENCGLIQLNQTANPDLMYKTGSYGYKSSISNTMKNHLKQYNEEIQSKKFLTKNSVVLDIGCNDGTFLKYYSNQITRIGIDPTGDQFKDYYNNTNIKLIADYFTSDVFVEHNDNLKCDIVTSICMFYDLPEPVQFAKDIHNILSDNGIWSCEQSYLLTMLKTNSLDTICHEHLEYYCLTPVKKIADMAGFKIIDIKFNESNGGSFRIYFCKRSCTEYDECTELIQEILSDEHNYNVKSVETYNTFMELCNSELKKLTDFLDVIKINKKRAYLYGASTKGNCILQHCNITEDTVKYAVERNPDKIGRSTITGIEIISEETMRENPPDYLVVLPWHFKKEIIEREKEYLDNGGQFIFYFPNFEIISNREKVLVTGCDGYIGNYVKNIFTNKNLYGISRTNSFDSIDKTVKFVGDINDKQFLKKCVKIINPDKIIHLASVTSSIDAYNTPYNTINSNGNVCLEICDILHNIYQKTGKKTKFFNASSSEIYKDHIVYELDDEEGNNSLSNMKNLHPYSIGKILGTQSVSFYRNKYNLPFSNGIIFTVQSAEKSNKFLFGKIKEHIQKIISGNKEILKIGSLNSLRNIIHPYDTANAINYILNETTGDDYLICGDKSYLILDLVKQIYLLNGININYNEHTNQFKYNNEVIVDLNKKIDGLEQQNVNITGKHSKLINIGWKQKYSIDDIINEFKII
tara:strand:- start:12405 stop:14621 length:2217 start_codon:yes stop_codon:yes gene_type:complete